MKLQGSFTNILLVRTLFTGILSDLELFTLQDLKKFFQDQPLSLVDTLVVLACGLPGGYVVG